MDVDEYTFRPVEKQTQAINFAVDIYPFLPVLAMKPEPYILWNIAILIKFRALGWSMTWLHEHWRL